MKVTEDTCEIEVDSRVPTASALSRSILLSPNRRYRQGLRATRRSHLDSLRAGFGPVRYRVLDLSGAALPSPNAGYPLSLAACRCQQVDLLSVGRYELKPPPVFVPQADGCQPVNP